MDVIADMYAFCFWVSEMVKQAKGKEEAVIKTKVDAPRGKNGKKVRWFRRFKRMKWIALLEMLQGGDIVNGIMRVFFYRKGCEKEGGLLEGLWKRIMELGNVLLSVYGLVFFCEEEVWVSSQMGYSTFFFRLGRVAVVE